MYETVVFFLLSVCPLLALAVLPVSVFTAKSLDIHTLLNGDTDIGPEYELDWTESSAYSFIRRRKEQIIRSALGTRFASMNVNNTHIKRDGADLFAEDFAWTSTSDDKPGITTYTTPAVSCMPAQIS